MKARVNLLVELGVEELPTKAVLDLSAAGIKLWQKALADASLAFCMVETFATPRRLAWRIRDLVTKQADQVIERKGPSLKSAKNADGQWTKAALGFANSCGVSVEDLSITQTDKGQWLMFYGQEKGQSLQQLFPALFAQVMHGLPIAKRMRWGEHEHAFVRPVMSLLVLADDEILPLEFFGVSANRYSLGHRVHHPAPVRIDNALSYEQALEKAYVVANPETRMAIIRKQVAQKAADLGGYALINEALLAEVSSLVEWPVAVAGHFEARFLAVPQEVLITTMQDNQKTFAVVDEYGKIMPHFIAIANIESGNEAVVRQGNEKVIRPRFADAEFFWRQDLKHQLSELSPRLERVVFQEKLGSLADKTRRMVQVAEKLAPLCQANITLAEQAASLAKCDLLSEMVMEFPELQGIMGRYYAEHEGLDEEIAKALEEQYYPVQSGGELPKTATGVVLALAEKLDTLIGGFAIGAKPTGSKDPYALRRMAIGFIRLVIEKKLTLSLQSVLQIVAASFALSLNAQEQVDDVKAYILDRLQGYYREQGVAVDIYQAVRAVVDDDLLDFDHRLQALQRFSHDKVAPSLLASAKRIRNILRKHDNVSHVMDERLFTEKAEHQLWQQWQKVGSQLTGDYVSALHALGSLAEVLEIFFQDVMVNVEDQTLRENRFALLQTLQMGFEQVADLSLLSG